MSAPGAKLAVTAPAVEAPLSGAPPAVGTGAALLSGLARGAFLGAAAWAAVGAVPALMLLPAATVAGALERYGARGGWRRVAVALGTGPLAAALALLTVLQGIYLQASLAAGPLAGGQLVAEVVQGGPADPDPGVVPAAREWLAGLPWWHSTDERAYCLLGTATLLGAILGLLTAGRLLLGVGPWRAPAGPEARVLLQVRLPGLVTLLSTVGACALGVVWGAWSLPAPPPGEPGLQGLLSLWGFAVLIGMAAPLAWGLTDLLVGLRWPSGGPWPAVTRSP